MKKFDNKLGKHIDKEFKQCDTPEDFLKSYGEVYACMALYYRLFRDDPDKALFRSSDEGFTADMLNRFEDIHRIVHKGLDEMYGKKKETL